MRFSHIKMTYNLNLPPVWRLYIHSKSIHYKITYILVMKPLNTFMSCLAGSYQTCPRCWTRRTSP